MTTPLSYAIDHVRMLQAENKKLEKQLVGLQALLDEYRTVLANYAECGDGCTCGDGWSHDLAIEALAQTSGTDALDKMLEEHVVGYLPAYELDRLSSGHDARLRSAKFGASTLDGDTPLYTRPERKP